MYCNIFIFPTDTVPGIGCNISSQSINKIYKIKKRDNNKPFALYADIDSIQNFAHINQWQYDIIKKNTPGSNTFVLKVKDKRINNALYCAKMGTIAFRIPNSPTILNIIKNNVICGTSVNISGEKPLSELNDIKREFKNIEIMGTKDEYQHNSNMPSNIINLSNNIIDIKYRGQKNTMLYF